MATPEKENGRAVFETQDLNLASYLRCCDFDIKDVRQERTRTIFRFADSVELRRAVLNYANDGPVGGRSFSNTLRDLKALVRDIGAADWEGVERRDKQ